MAAVTFDTLKFVETLRDAGMPEAQAKAISHAVCGAHEMVDLVTGRDLREAGTGPAPTCSRCVRKFSRTCSRCGPRCALSNPRLTFRLGGVVVVALGVFTALSKWAA